ncbi:UPF0716 protein FxsA [Rhodothalassium salexigens DSM 2132]|uniref:UPF0716 protein FxsA n=1 Tax=Rhodothalassium salexigens DSM 2132 TaxID=1188247 RepID=A0A4R2PKR1_RHOSA|nr:FxsA family protein [Rhodothalassium salexigens]MBB4211175.1 UPF0716 protein FxsA [Rhodothalassium salexigens DSM 2132]TCP36169.1 UPF0716 protein FxsA [Rhodothalassium salexigens DSM 2132]
MRTSVGLVLILLLVGLPLAELYAFGLAGQAIGLGWTVLLTIATAVIGVSIVRLQGRDLVLRIRAAADRGEPLIGDVLEGLLLALSGVCLFLPGLLTDAVGFVLLIPGLRRLLIAWGVGSMVNAMIVRTETGAGPDPRGHDPRFHDPRFHGRPHGHGSDDIIDLEPDAVRYGDDDSGRNGDRR